jgi:hypothetical protein
LRTTTAPAQSTTLNHKPIKKANITLEQVVQHRQTQKEGTAQIPKAASVKIVTKVVPNVAKKQSVGVKDVTTMNENETGLLDLLQVRMINNNKFFLFFSATNGG